MSWLFEFRPADVSRSWIEGAPATSLRQHRFGGGSTRIGELALASPRLRLDPHSNSAVIVLGELLDDLNESGGRHRMSDQNVLVDQSRALRRVDAGLLSWASIDIAAMGGQVLCMPAVN